MIETLLDKSLFQLFIKIKYKCSISDICLIGLQIIDRLEFIHSKDIIYRDVKPENFLFGINDPNVLYIIDFGLCKKYRSSKTGKHLMPKLTGKFNGTLRYASPNAIKGKESSRRDDLISLGYLLIFIYKKELPWQETFKNLNKKKYLELCFLKDTNDSGKLFNNLPPEFKEYIKYCRNLKFEQDPDYEYLRSIFTRIISNNNFDYKKISFSWINNKNKKFLGIPIDNSRRKASPKSRLYKSIQELRIKRLNRESRSEINLLKNIKNLDLTSNKTELLKSCSISNNEKSEKNFDEQNSFITKIKLEEKQIIIYSKGKK